jgi:hypothetical protein
MLALALLSRKFLAVVADTSPARNFLLRIRLRRGFGVTGDADSFDQRALAAASTSAVAKGETKKLRKFLE